MDRRCCKALYGVQVEPSIFVCTLRSNNDVTPTILLITNKAAKFEKDQKGVDLEYNSMFRTSTYSVLARLAVLMIYLCCSLPRFDFAR